GLVGGHILRLDLVERHGRGVDEPRAGRTVRKQLWRHDRARIEADGAAREQVAAPHGNEVGRARPRADEMHGHRSPAERASAQVTGPTTMRGPSRLASGPAAASAAVSARLGRPVSTMLWRERVAVRVVTASSAAWLITCSG